MVDNSPSPADLQAANALLKRAGELLGEEEGEHASKLLDLAVKVKRAVERAQEHMATPVAN